MITLAIENGLEMGRSRLHGRLSAGPGRAATERADRAIVSGDRLWWDGLLSQSTTGLKRGFLNSVVG
jgi:hypothetical protein